MFSESLDAVRRAKHCAWMYGRPVPDLCSWFNDHMHEWGHQYLYDRPALDRALASAGFADRGRKRSL